MTVTQQLIKKVRALSGREAQEVLDFLEEREHDEAEQDRLDAEAARRALAEAEKEGFVPWESVRSELELNDSPPKPDIKALVTSPTGGATATGGPARKSERQRSATRDSKR